jgi:hypothetical protein
MTPLLQSSTNLKRSTLAELVDQSTILLMTAIGSLILILALLILFHENANATKGYKLRTLEHQRTQLLLEQEIQQMQIAEQQALEKLQDDPKIKAMVQAKTPTYVTGVEAVASR